MRLKTISRWLFLMMVSVIGNHTFLDLTHALCVTITLICSLINHKDRLPYIRLYAMLIEMGMIDFVTMNCDKQKPMQV